MTLRISRRLSSDPNALVYLAACHQRVRALPAARGVLDLPLS